VEDRRVSLASGVVRSSGSARIVEPELDMNRQNHHTPVVMTRLARIVRWLMPETRRVGPPMRSIAREMEEAFPSLD